MEYIRVFPDAGNGAGVYAAGSRAGEARKGKGCAFDGCGWGGTGVTPRRNGLVRTRLTTRLEWPVRRTRPAGTPRGSKEVEVSIVVHEQPATTKRDRVVLRDLAKRMAEIACMEKQDTRRDLWRKHNSLVKTRPPVLVRPVAARTEIMPDAALECEDPLLRSVEYGLRMTLFQDNLDDDCIVEPWVTVRASYATPANASRWGPEIKHSARTEARGSWMFDPPIKAPDDLSTLVRPRHLIDEDATARCVSLVHDVIGDLLEVDVDRGPLYRSFLADLAYDSTQLRGLEQVMWDMVDRPEWLHQLMRFLMEGVLAAQDEAEAKGDWQLTNGANQAMTYSLELPDPEANSSPVARAQLWGFAAAQEYALISPAMHEEFLLRYQIPILARFGLVAYGCCEDLTQKLNMLKQIPNLRRVAITPVADVAASAENLGRDYVLSWRPNPAEVICNGFDPERTRAVLERGLAAADGCNVEILLKDVETVEGQAWRFRKFTRIAREVAEQHAP
ncbi:MAG: hypothetical protein HY332_13915 [Chloroflexi bacterium]|nr:hypothetical protein [Chloroflexota bacterium]